MRKLLILMLSLSTIIAYNPTIYEISLRPWLYELTNKYGYSITKINDIPISEFTELKSKGVDYVWLMGNT